MGRLHVPETGADPTIAEMGLREGGEDRWSSELDRCRLLSRVAASPPFPTAVWESRMRATSLGKQSRRRFASSFLRLEGAFNRVTADELQDVCWFLMLLLRAS